MSCLAFHTGKQLSTDVSELPFQSAEVEETRLILILESCPFAT